MEKGLSTLRKSWSLLGGKLWNKFKGWEENSLYTMACTFSGIIMFCITLISYLILEWNVEKLLFCKLQIEFMSIKLYRLCVWCSVIILTNVDTLITLYFYVCRWNLKKKKMINTMKKRSSK